VYRPHIARTKMTDVVSIAAYRLLCAILPGTHPRRGPSGAGRSVSVAGHVQ
jgi:hypothetical protein